MNPTTTISAEPHDAGPCLWRLDLNGRFALVDTSGRDVTPKARKSRAILAYLTANPGERVARDKLIDLLWGDRFESQARLSLRQSLFEIRRSTGDTLLQSDREHLWIEPSAVEIVQGAGEPFAGLSGITSEFDDWLQVERERRGNQTFAQLGREAEAFLNEHRGEEAVPLIERMRQIDPLHDAWVRLAMKADHQAGNPSAIHKRFKEFCRLLEQELGASPASETRALHDWLIADLTRKPPESPQQPPAEIVSAPQSAAQPARAGLPHKFGLFAYKRRFLLAVAAIIPFVLIAVGAREAAVKERHEAEKMAEFMLGDAKQNMEPIGKISAIEGVAARVVDFYKGKSNSDLSDAELMQRSRALGLLAQAENMRGDAAKSIQLYGEAAAGTAEAVRRKPGDPQRLFDHAQNVFWIGELERRRGNIDAAEAQYRKYKRLADQMSGLEPDNLKWRMEVLYANEDLGIALFYKRQFAEAASQFENALRPMQSVISIDSGNADYQKELPNLLGWLADAYRATGRMDAAVAIRQRQIGNLEQSISRGAEDVGLREKLVPADEGLGVLYSERGQTEQAIEEHRSALQAAERLLALEPRNAVWINWAANIRFELAKNLLAAGRRDEAMHEASAACKAADDLLQRDPSVTLWRHLRTMCFSTASQLALASNAKTEALDLAGRAVAAAHAENSPDKVQNRYIIASASLLLGDVRRERGDAAAATAAWTEGLAQLPAHVAESPWEMKEHAELLSRVGRTAEAGAIEAHLDAIGYRRSGYQN